MGLNAATAFVFNGKLHFLSVVRLSLALICMMMMGMTVAFSSVT